MQKLKPASLSEGWLSGYKGYLWVFSLSAITAALFLLPWLFAGDSFYIGSDFVLQQVPFWSYCNDAIKTGNVFWSDSLDLGTQFIGGFSFYVIGSPFFWLSLLVPAHLFYQFSAVFLILKIGVAGLAAYTYLRQYTKTASYALLASLLYAFCGFQISNLNFNHFADVLALFPFLLFVLDKAVLQQKRFVFALVVALCALCNWYCFIGEIVFLVLYLGIKIWSHDYPKLKISLVARLAAESILGVGLAAFLLVPSLLFISGNPRSLEGFATIGQMLFPKPIVLAELVRGMLFPPESGFFRGFFLEALFNGGELYLPLFGLVPAVAYALTQRKSFEARILLVSLIFMVIPILNSLFVAFNAEYYTRWFYMPTLMLCLASAKVLETPSFPLKRGYAFYGGLWGIFFLFFLWFTFYFKVTFFFNIVPVLLYVTVSIAGFAITLFVRKIQSFRHGFALLTAGVMGFAVICGMYNIYQMHKRWEATAPQQLYTAPETITLPETQQYYRIDADGYHYYNIGTMLGMPSMDSFSSTINASIFDFYDLIEEPRSVISNLPSSEYGYRAFLSAKYWIRYGETASANESDGWHSYATQGNYHIFENEYYIPLGFCYDFYITETDFKSIAPEERHLLFVEALVLSETQAAEYDDVLKRLQNNSVGQDSFENNVTARQAQSASSSHKTNSGYSLTIDLEKQNLVFLSIPWDTGWTAEVNGIATPIEKVSGGFMAVFCDAGENNIVLTYTPSGGLAGFIISLVSGLTLLLWAAWIIVRRKLQKNVKMRRICVENPSPLSISTPANNVFYVPPNGTFKRTVSHLYHLFFL